MQQSRRKVVKAAAVSSAVLVGLAAGSALAAPIDHTNIVLKDWQGNAIARPTDGGAAPAYSSKQTCFGGSAVNGDGETVNCHGNGTGTMKYTYDDIEKHSYHTQLGANEFRGWNPANPDGDKWQAGAGPQGKNWVQSPGHFGSW